jgi:hypothetical protein
MKTTKSTSLEKRIQKLVSEKKLSKSSIVYGWLNDILKGTKSFRPVYTQGRSWKHSSLIDKRFEFQNILNQLGIEYIEGNDAPRGGKTGAFIKITTKVI